MIQGGTSLYYRVLFVLEGTSLHYNFLLSTTRVLLRTIKYGVVLRGITLCYKVRVCTTLYEKYPFLSRGITLYYRVDLVSLGIILYYEVILCIEKYDVILRGTIVYYNVRLFTTRYYFVLESTTLYYEVLPCVAKCDFGTKSYCSVLQGTVLHY